MNRLRLVVALVAAVLLGGCTQQPIEGERGERLGVAVDVNDANVILTAGFIGDAQVAYLYDANNRDLDAVPGPLGVDFVPQALNNRGVVVGSLVTGTGRERRPRAVRWFAGNFFELPLPEGTFQSWATDVNSDGEIVINAFSPSGSPSDGAYVWLPASGLTRLADPAGDSNGRPSVAEAINDSGIVVGASGRGSAPGKERAVQWSVTRVPEFLGGPGDTTRALDINESGTIVGTSLLGTGEGRAAAWFSALHTYLDLGPGTANGLNDNNVVVGQRSQGAEPRAHAWLVPSPVNFPIGTPGGSSLANAVNAQRAVGAANGESVEFTLQP